MIYSAAITSGRRETAEKYVQDNVVTAIYMMNFCRIHHVKRIIYLSSDEIYGELNTDVVTEKAVMVNPNLYAATKYLAEKIIIESGVPYYILRLPGVVGRVWGENFIYRLMDQIRSNERLELYNVERDFNNMIDIDDLTQFIGLLCQKEGNSVSEIFVLGNVEKMKLKDVVSYIKELYHSVSLLHSIDTEQKRYFILSVDRAVEYGYSSKKIKTILNELYQIRKG